VDSVAVSGDGRLVASGSEDCTAKLWDPATGRCLHTFSLPGLVRLVIFSPDSTLLASVTFNHIQIWNMRSHNLISTIASRCQLLAFSPNGTGNRLVSLTRDLKLKLWEVATGTCLASLDIGRSFKNVVFGVDGTSVILGNDDSPEVAKYGIFPTHSSSNDERSSFPMEFVLLHDVQPSVSSHFFCHREGDEWIIDEQDKRVLWVPPDLRHRSDSWGKKVALGSPSGRVAMVDISDVQN